MGGALVRCLRVRGGRLGEGSALEEPAGGKPGLRVGVVSGVALDGDDVDRDFGVGGDGDLDGSLRGRRVREGG